MAKVKKCPEGYDIHVSADEALTLACVFRKIGGYGFKFNSDPVKQRPTRRAHTEDILDQLVNLGVSNYASGGLTGGLMFNEPLE